MHKQRPKRPREPAPSDCCGSGCSRCVWDVYFDDLAKYEESIQEQKTQEEDFEDDEGVVSDSSTEDDNAESQDYVGSVVVKYVKAPTSENTSMTPEVAVSTILKRYSPVHDVRLVLSSGSYISDNDVPNGDEGQAVQIVDVQLGSSCEFGKMGTPALPLPGDVVEMFVPNDHDTDNSGRFGEVEMLCERLGLDPDQWCEIHRSPFVPPDHFPSWLPLQRQLQIRTLFAYFVDIGSCSYLLRPAFFQTLLRLSAPSKTTPILTFPNEAIDPVKLLERCASKETVPLIYRRMMNGSTTFCYPRLIDMLNVFSFVKFPIARLLEVTGPLRPRRFSVAHHTLGKSAAAEELRSVQLCLRRVDVGAMRSVNFENGKDDAVQVLEGLLRGAAMRRLSVSGKKDYLFTGHVSHPLCNFSSRSHTLPMFAGTRLFGTTPFARGLMEALRPFALQTTAATTLPLLILVGAGTGIAPLVSAVHELVRHRQSTFGSRTLTPNCWVVYGARNYAELVYHRQLQEALELNAISRYDVALSRTSEGVHPRHVTDVLESQAEKVRSALLCGDGRLFACGPAAALRSLRQRLQNCILASADDDESVREQRMQLLEKRGQLMFDVWGTVSIFE